jgi:dihydrofolate synthase/folylpolyglutamate synthase
MNYEEAVHYLFSLGNEVLTAKLGLQNISTLLSYLGNPHQQFPSLVIAGTNGKGSVAAFCESILRESGRRTGLYSSPHLVRVEERVQVNKRMISPEDFARLTSRLKGDIKELTSDFVSPSGLKLDRHPTYFEVMTALGFLYFSEQQVEVAILEVGMGGRFDATNIVDPVVSIITNVDFDHQEHLGSRLEEIAGEKAGIIKSRPAAPDAGRVPQFNLLSPLPVVTAARNPIVLSVIENRCRETGSRPVKVWEKFQPEINEDQRGRCRVKVDTLWEPGQIFHLPLPGRHQVENALTALAAVEILAQSGWNISAEAVTLGLEKASWPGRLEILERRPALIFDGAHNPAGAGQLAEYLRHFLRPERTLLIFGVMRDKDYQSMGRILFPLAHEVILTRTSWVRAADPAQIQQGLSEFAGRYHCTRNSAEAMDLAFGLAEEDDTIVIAGSLFLVGEIRQVILQRGMGFEE